MRSLNPKTLCIFFLLFFGITRFTSYSQDLPRIIPPSPEVSAMVKFLDYPIDYCTGVPDIQIPIYEIKSGSLSVPIGISYRASGRKVYDVTGPIGLGWNLSAGGVVTRTLYGHADENSEVPMDIRSPSNINQYTPDGYDYLAGTEKYIREPAFTYKDCAYDVFSYSFLGHSGKFVLKDNNGVKTPVLIPYRPYKVSFVISSFGTSPDHITQFTIVDDKGISYTFSGAESVWTGTESAFTAWHLVQITSADKSDVINFVYTSFRKDKISFSEYYALIDHWQIGWNCNQQQDGCPSRPPLKELHETKNEDQYQIDRLSEISFKEGSVKFILGTNPVIDQVKNIQILKANGDALKTIEVQQSIQDYLSDGNPPTQKLDNLIFKDRLGDTVEQYSFKSYPTPMGMEGGVVNCRSRDYWGFLNGSAGSSGIIDMIPYYENIPTADCDGQGAGYTTIGGFAYREPRLDATKSGVLKKIIYPTGGSAEFVYEQNKYKNPQNSQIKDCGGLRIYQIKNDDGKGNVTYKTYKYGINENGYGVCNLIPGMNYMMNTTTYGFIARGQTGWDCGGTYLERDFLSDFTTDLSELAELPAIYSEVTEYYGTEASNIGKSIYKYELYDPKPFIQPYSAQPKYHISKYNFWDDNNLSVRTDYKNENGTYVIKKNTVSSYDRIETEQVTSLRVRREMIFPSNTTNIYPVSPYDYPAAGGWQERYAATYMDPPSGIFRFPSYTVSVGKKLLGQTIETTYTDNGKPITITTNYTYNANDIVSKVEKIISNNNDAVSQNFQYPFDFSTNPVCQTMVTDHMLNYVIQEDDYKNTTPTKSIKTNYYNWGTTLKHLIYPQTIDVRKGTNSFETRLHYYDYDNGNPLSISKENDVRISYIWGYNNTYPIAEARNAKQNEIFFTSFEDGTGWDNHLTAYDNTKFNSGKYSGRIDKSTTEELYSLGANWLSVSLTQPTKFHYSGWVYSNGPSADIYLFMKRAGETGYYSYIDRVSTTTINKWVYIEKDFSVPADVTQLNTRLDNNGGGIVWFDDIRLHPSNAMMTTYTYEPLTGMTSQTDVNNQNTYFDYDNYGRLKAIRDMNRNILKTYDYKYQSPTP